MMDTEPKQPGKSNQILTSCPTGQILSNGICIAHVQQQVQTETCIGDQTFDNINGLCVNPHCIGHQAVINGSYADPTCKGD